MAGPLQGIRIVEIAAIGPAPFACMMLADHGAEVTRVEHPDGPAHRDILDPAKDVLARSRTVVRTDLKSPQGVAEICALAATADAIVEGFRPGVMERLGLGPDRLCAANPRLVYARMTGWGQDGPYARRPGHDLNYIALAGVLDPLGRAGAKPTPPLNLLADFGGGGMLLAFAVVSAILHARTTGQGQVIDCAMVDGAALLGGMIWGLKASGTWSPERGTNLLDTGAPFYEVYETADARHIAIAALEPQFYARLRDALGLAQEPAFANQFDRSTWPAQKAALAALFRTRTRDDWTTILEGADVCFAPVVTMDEAPHHPHLAARGTYADIDGVIQPMPAPRYSATGLDRPRMPCDAATTSAPKSR